MKTNYLFNCFLLLIPILFWNILFYHSLPEAYQSEVFGNEIPSYISLPENILRILVFGFPLLMRLSLKERIQRIGILMYIIGIIIYFSSWLVLILYPESFWSLSLIGFSAPAFTPIIWLIGIGLVGNKSFINIPQIQVLYILTSILFICFHTAHVHHVFGKI